MPQNYFMSVTKNWLMLKLTLLAIIPSADSLRQPKLILSEGWLPGLRWLL